MSDERKCPSCGKPGKSARGDLVFCGACGAGFFAPDWQPDPAPLPAAEAPPLKAPVIIAFHAGVLAAEIALSALVAGIVLGGPVLMAAWLAGCLS